MTSQAEHKPRLGRTPDAYQSPLWLSPDLPLIHKRIAPHKPLCIRVAQDPGKSYTMRDPERRLSLIRYISSKLVVLSKAPVIANKGRAMPDEQSNDLSHAKYAGSLRKCPV